MFRGLLILTSTVVAVIAMLIGVVGFGMHKIAAAQKEADASWRPEAVEAVATTNPSVEPIMASDSQEPAVQQNASIELAAKDATLHGAVQLVDNKNAPPKVEKVRDERAAKRIKQRMEMGGHAVTTHLAGFNRKDDYAEWAVELPKAGEYEIDLTYGCAKWNEGGRFVLALAGKELRGIAESTRYETNFRVITLGKLNLPAGKTVVTIRPDDRPMSERFFLNVRDIHIIPTFD